MSPSPDRTKCARCQQEPRLEYHSYCRMCKRISRREEWARMPQYRKEQLLAERRKYE